MSLYQTVLPRLDTQVGDGSPVSLVAVLVLVLSEPGRPMVSALAKLSFDGPPVELHAESEIWPEQTLKKVSAWLSSIDSLVPFPVLLSWSLFNGSAMTLSTYSPSARLD
jgi:hypothetical protein